MVTQWQLRGKYILQGGARWLTRRVQVALVRARAVHAGKLAALTYARTPPCEIRRMYTVCSLTGRGGYALPPLPVRCI